MRNHHQEGKIETSYSLSQGTNLFLQALASAHLMPTKEEDIIEENHTSSKPNENQSQLVSDVNTIRFTFNDNATNVGDRR